MTTTRIHADRLLPGDGDPVLDAVLVLDGTTITYAGPAAGAPETPDAEVVRVPTVLPGLWDCHTHFFGQPDMSLARVVTERVDRGAMRVVGDAGRALLAGFTSVREVGGFGTDLEHVRRQGLLRGPTIYSAGAILSPTGGHADVHDLPLDLVHAYGATGGMLRMADGVDGQGGVLRAVREQLRKDARLIKICASGGVLSEVDSPHHQEFTMRELRAIVEEAAMADRIVAAHCHGEAGVEAAIEAGVHTIEHGSYLTEDTCDAMVERGMVLVPTRSIVDALLTMVRAPGVSPRSMAKGFAIDEAHGTSTELAIERGVTVACGTDFGTSDPAGPTAWGRNGRELELLVGHGMTPLEAIRAATAVGPLTLGPQAPRSGQLLAGYDADVLAVDGDPSTDISVLAEPANVVGVWQAGERVVDRPDGVRPRLVPLS
jgi:imidazolonepropionase-like amidohydrolase